MEQEPIEVTLVRLVDGALLGPAWADDSRLFAYRASAQGADVAGAKRGKPEPWTLVPSAVRVAEQERLAKYDALASRLTEGPEGLGDGEEYAGSWAILRDLRTLAALAPPAPPEGEQP